MNLTDDDKTWLIGQLEILRTEVRDTETRLTRKITEEIGDTETRLTAKISAAEAKTTDTETNLLSEFWKWARTAEIRYRQSHANTAFFEERMQAMEDRVADLERKK